MRSGGPAIGLSALLVCGLTGPGRAEESLARDLQAVVYDFEVTSYCGLVSDAVAAGFKREYVYVLRRDKLTDEEASRARQRAWVAAEEEWGNRGLGGFRAWCREEGEAAAAHFRKFLHQGPP